MPRNSLGSLRRSAVASLFGPGAVIDFRAGDAPVSAVAAGLEEWDQNFRPAGLLNEQSVHEARLQKKLGVRGFRLPPVLPERLFGKDDDRSLVAVRFPSWQQCPACNRIAEARAWADEPGQPGLHCPSCTQKAPRQRKVYVVPVRFVMACEAGHLDEFPWHWWVGHRESCPKPRFLKLASKRPGLAGLFVSCPTCHAERSMDGVFSEATWNALADCQGRTPWRAGPADRCAHKPRAVQRGASNLYFPVVESALSIPPWTDRLQEAIGADWHRFISIEDPAERALLVKLMSREQAFQQTLDDLGLTGESFLAALDARIREHAAIDTEDLRSAEYRQFTSGMADRGTEREFEMRPQTVPASIAPWISTIVKVVRLREVRALTGFTRIHPPGDSKSPNVAPLSRSKLEWLPAIEVRGEGIFLELAEEALRLWETQEAVVSRIAELDKRWQADWRDRFPDSPVPFRLTPRRVLVHSFAHSLMRQLTLDCGYASTSLRERLYAGDPESGMAGLLIYTATPDDDGTLGGLQREGDPVRIARSIQAAIQAQAWCSSDPLCIEDLHTGSSGLSLAACHACVLAPETSCEEFNQFLDRALLVGTPTNAMVGFFNQLIVGHE